MKLSINANICDQTTAPIADILHPHLKAISHALSKDYGGSIEHLWIDFELNEAHSQMRPPHAFRFQKKVGGSVHRMTGLPTPVHNNVGHYGVRPNFDKLRRISSSSVIDYVLTEIYRSTVVLLEKQAKLGGFDAPRFRSDFAAYCAEHGHSLSQSEI